MKKGHLIALLSAVLLVLPIKSRVQDRAHQLAASAPKAKPAACTAAIHTFKDCHPKYPNGCDTVSGTKQPNYDAYLDFLKNQAPAGSLPSVGNVSAADISSKESKLPSGMGPFNHANFAQNLAPLGEGNIYTIVGYLYYHEPGGVETCNCKLGGASNDDFHIGIGFDQSTTQQIAGGSLQVRSTKGQPSTTAERTSIIVEMTPYYRATFHPKWTEAALDSVVGKQVKVVGQLLVDNDHFNADDDCGFSGAHTASCWRMSAWELHPVLAFYVCKNGAGCGNDSSDWVELDNLPAP
jgi:hypothetical protein